MSPFFVASNEIVADGLEPLDQLDRTLDVDAVALRLADLALEGRIDPNARSWAQTLRPDGRAEAPWL